MRKVAGFGIANVDLIFGNVSRMPRLGEELYSKSYTKQLGGGVAATLIQLSRLGVPVDLATYLGKGPLSGFVREELEKNQITYTNMLSTQERDPVTLSCIVSCQQDRGIISYKPEESAFAVEKRKVWEFYQESSIAYLSLDQIEFCRALKENGCMVVLDSAWSDMLSLELYAEVFPYVDYFIPNAMEAMKITKTETPIQALEVLAQYLKHPIVKNGNDGCLYQEKHQLCQIAPMPVMHVDSTGAGDAFAGGFLYGLYYGYPLADCIRFGNITGGNAVTEIGCLTAQMSEEKLKECYQKVYGKQQEAAVS